MIEADVQEAKNEDRTVDAVLALTPAAFEKTLQTLEKEMLACAKNLEFEKAASLRDRMTAMKQMRFYGR